MTATEILREFELLYSNNISHGGSAGLNSYEISLYLTNAQKEIIKNYYSGTSKGVAVDSEESVKSLLSLYTSIISINSFSTSTQPTNGLIVKKATIPSKVWYILRESVTNGTKEIPVKPILQDEYLVSVDNPFRRPNGNKVWRLDQKEEADTDRMVTLLSKDEFTKYTLVYIEKPTPIVLEDLSEVLAGLTIEGVSEQTIPSQLTKNNWLTKLIISRAVELATKDYRENTLEGQLLLNNRVE